MDKDFLKGKRIAITALELENKEHRGIASFIKSSIHILSKYGAEVYLITGFDCSKNFKNSIVAWFSLDAANNVPPPSTGFPKSLVE